MMQRDEEENGICSRCHMPSDRPIRDEDDVCSGCQWELTQIEREEAHYQKGEQPR